LLLLVAMARQVYGRKYLVALPENFWSQ